MDAEHVLAKVEALPVSPWTYKHYRGVEHIGPVAQDFKTAFGLGRDDLTIALTDLSGVALAAIQGLATQQRAAVAALQQGKDQQIAALVDEVAELRVLVQQLLARQHTAVVGGH